jgi:zinc transport system substrate-binding protein
MNNKLLIFFSVLFYGLFAQAKPKIVTSIMPVASIISMLTEDHVEIVSINTSSGCPHHHQMKPSDLDKISGADMLIYIDDYFDGSAKKTAKNFEGKIVKISDIKTINFIGENNIVNWHFWLDLDNVLAPQEEVANVIIKEMPQLKTVISDNKEKAGFQINYLKQLKQNELNSLPELVVASDSMEHFFKGADANIIKLYQKSNSSLKDYQNLERALNTTSSQFIIVDKNQNSDIYHKFNKKIIRVDSENWTMTDNENITELFSARYLDIINLLKQIAQK